MADIDLSSVFSDALSGAKSMTQQAGGVYQQAQNSFTTTASSRRELNIPAPEAWASATPPTQSPYGYATSTPQYVGPASYGYGYGAPSGYNWGQTGIQQNTGYPGFTSPTYGKGGY